MATKVVYTVREDKHGLQKQLGCIKGIFHVLDRGYLLGLHRHWRNQNKIATGQGDDGEKELKKSSQKAKEKNQKKMTTEKNRTSIESSRNSASSSCSSTTSTSFDCSKQVQAEWQLPSEPTSRNLHKKQPEWSLPPPDIRDVVKDSMTRVIRVTKDERVCPVMKHIDSPRPFMHQHSVEYDRKDRNLVKTQKISSAVKKMKEASRFSCDERESQYSLKSSFKVEELPRLSLDSKRNSKMKSMNESRSDPGSNKRPSSGIVARLMGLDSLTDSICEVETVKIKSDFGDRLGSSSPSPRVHSKIKPALQQQEGGDKPGSPTVKGTSSPKRRELLNRAVKPAKMDTEPVMVKGLHCVNHKAKKQVKDPAPRNNKATGRRSRSLQDLTGERPISSPRQQRSKNGIDKQCFHEPSSDSSKLKKQPKLKTRHLKTKPINLMQNSNETRNLSQDDDAVNSCKSESKPKVMPLSENNFAERLIEDKPMVELAKLTMEQTSPISVLDAFYLEDAPSPVNKKTNAFNDYGNLRIDEPEWNQVGIYNPVTGTDAGDFHQIELLSSSDGEKTESPCKSINEEHKYIREILLATGFLKDPDTAIKIAQLQSTDSLIKPELFHILEKTNDERHKNPSSRSNEKVRRKLIFDSVNDILFHKLAMSGFSGKRCKRYVDGEMLLTELWSEIDNLQSGSERFIYGEEDEFKILVSADLDKNSKNWDKYSYEVPGLVLDIERCIFKDLIDEIVNAYAAQDGLGKHCRRLFSM
ncbi:hypothetical protein SSX86_025114 [Deinandra increscens subsp. villosa]|uniref:DUF4378 domain-containing protein n=1 Tax=Deinandra increscens subsp. villosa TaxID=3103831 RepID=A0AAP0CIM0_9ASTR